MKGSRSSGTANLFNFSKTSVLGLSNDIKSISTGRAVWPQSTKVTDRQTDRRKTIRERSSRKNLFNVACMQHWKTNCIQWNIICDSLGVLAIPSNRPYWWHNSNYNYILPGGRENQQWRVVSPTAIAPSLLHSQNQPLPLAFLTLASLYRRCTAP